jgi:hypothetical protein
MDAHCPAAFVDQLMELRDAVKQAREKDPAEYEHWLRDKFSNGRFDCFSDMMARRK